MFANADGIPIELHTHCTTGLGPLCCLEAVKLGIKIVNTALPPLADGSSNPSLFNVAKNLRALGYKPLIDEEILKPVSDHFTYIAKREGFPIGEPVEYDYSQYQHQVPGGMISNLRSQLRKVGLEKQDRPSAGRNHARARRARLPDHGHAAVAIRRQPGGDQRHRRRALQGSHRSNHSVRARLLGQGRRRTDGRREVKAKIMDRPRAKEWAAWQPPEPTVAELRKKMNAENVSDEEFLLRWNLNVEEIEAMRAAGAPKEYLTARQPLVNLIDALSKRKDYRQIVIQKGEMVVSLNRSAPAS